MTALCGGGSSSPKPGVAETTIYGAGALATLLEELGNVWAKAAAPLLGVISYDSITLCSSDPPTAVALTDAEVTAVLNVQLGADLVSGLAKLRDIVLNGLWYDLCQCNSGPQPTEPPPLPEPINVVPAGPTSSCGSAGAGPLTTAVESPTVGFFPLITNGFKLPDGTVNPNFAPLVLPAGCTSIQFVSRNDSPVGTGSQYDTDTALQFFDSTTTFISQVIHQDYAAARTHTTTVTVPGTARSCDVQASAAASDGLARVLSAQITFLCNGAAPGSPAIPCCPPDPTLSALMLQIWNQVNLLQRRLAPIAYITGAAHSALTGQGSFIVDGLLGLKVHITTLPASYGEEVSTPTFRFLDSWVSMMTPDGVIDERRIAATDTVWTPPFATEATTWGYSFAPGIVATITELEPEP